MDATPLRLRRDGWTPDRQATFLAALTAGGSIAAAAAAAGMSRQAAYRLRRRSPAVAAAWSPAAAPVDMAALSASADAGLAQRHAGYAAAGEAHRRGADAWLIGELRVTVRRVKRRAAAARRAAAKAGRDGSPCRLPPRDLDGGGVVPDFTARARGAGGRFIAKNVVAT